MEGCFVGWIDRWCDDTIKILVSNKKRFWPQINQPTNKQTEPILQIKRQFKLISVIFCPFQQYTYIYFFDYLLQNVFIRHLCRLLVVVSGVVKQCDDVISVCCCPACPLIFCPSELLLVDVFCSLQFEKSMFFALFLHTTWWSIVLSYRPLKRGRTTPQLLW